MFHKINPKVADTDNMPVTKILWQFSNSCYQKTVRLYSKVCQCFLRFCICSFVAQSFPTPMEEPKKVLRAQYLGSTQVLQAAGMEVLNDAIDKMVTSVPQDQWQSVNVAVAPSMITIQQPSVSWDFSQDVLRVNHNSTMCLEMIVCHSI